MIKKESLTKIVGSGQVLQDTASLEAYSKDMSFVNAIKPRYVVKPKTSKAVQAIVKLANENQTPLVPVSSGAPHFKGDSIPSMGGSIVVDLSAMNKIMRVDRDHRVAMVEPGVTFGELIPAVEKVGLRLNMPLLPRKSKTVVGSMLEREPVMMTKYQWDISDPLACVEIVFGSGEKYMTGQAAGPGTVEEQWAAGGAQKTPYGPGPAQWFRVIQGAQGTMGIVTWASLRCEILPALEEAFVAGAASPERLLDLSNQLIRQRMVNECFLLNSANLAAIMAKKFPSDYLTLKNSLPRWILFFNFAGYEYLPEQRISSNIKGLAGISGKIGIEAGRSVGGVASTDILKVIKKPSDEPYWKLRYKGACQDIFFITTYSKIESQINAMYDSVNESGYPAQDMGVYVQPLVQGSNLHCEFNLFYDPENPVEVERVKKLTASATNALMAKGAFFSRPYGESAKMIVNRDAATVAALNKVKGILDPNRVMNPGKLCF